MIGRIEKRFNLYGEQVGKNSFDKFGSAMKVGEDRDNRHYMVL